MRGSGNSITPQEELGRAAMARKTERDREKEKSVRIKNNRPAGQGEKWEEAQGIVVLVEWGYKILRDLPTIPGQLPKIADVFRTTSGEKGLTVCCAG
jgi:hypothetical protein